MTQSAPRLYRRAAVVLAILPLAGFSGLEKAFAPDSELIDARWTEHNAASTTEVDHSAWGGILSTYLDDGADGVTRFDYGGVTEADRATLAAYIDQLEAVAVSDLNRDEQLAYWLNLYNAVTIDVVLDHYPVDTIQDIDISPGLFASGPWGRDLVTVEGQALSLNDVEHGIIRPVWNDPRIHYGVNCASIGCPDLLARPFSGANLDELLDAGARGYVNDPRGVSFEAVGDIIASKIYLWFEDDFGEDDADILAHLRRYAEPALRQRLAEARDIDGHEYDWSLNDTALRDKAAR